MQVNRRNMLELLGLAGTSYLASSMATPRRARAAGAAIPRRLVFFYSGHGALKQFNADGSLKPSQWAPTVTGAPDPLKILTPWSTSAFTLGNMHQALVPFQNQLLFLDGLDMMSVDVDPITAGDAHTNGQTHALIGANRKTSVIAGGISIDQYIAKGINSPSPVTSLGSLEVMIDAVQGAGTGPLYAAAGQPLPMAGKASSVYARMFPNGASGTTAADQARLAAQMAQQKSVLDHAANDFSNLAGRLGKLDAARLSSHADAIRGLEGRLAIGSTMSCPVPDPSLVASASSAGSAAAYAANADVHMRLVQTALACDLTRVATICVTQAPDDSFGYKANMSGTSDFHDMIHQTNGAGPPLAGDAAAMATVRAYHAYNASLFAKFLGLLQAIPESDGTTLLDNTVVVWCGDIAGGDHTLDRIPYVLAGGLGGTIKTGRYVRLPRKANMVKWPAYSDGIPHNNLFVSLANLMGVPTTTFGNPNVCTGPLVQALS
jgi:hypothetical protein